MNGVLKTLKDLKKVASNASKSTGGTGESNYLKLKDGESVIIRFLQELDESGENYDAARGTGIGIAEHSNPDNFKQHFACSADSEGRCLGCEKAATNRGWKAKNRYFINVLVKDGENAGKAKVFVTNFSKVGLAQDLIDYFEENNTLSDRDYKLTRRGEGKDTTYSLMPKNVSAFKVPKDVELVDLNKVIRFATYDEQVSLVGDSEDDSDW